MEHNRYKQRGLQFNSASDSRALRAVDFHERQKFKRSNAITERRQMDNLEDSVDNERLARCRSLLAAVSSNTQIHNTREELGRERYQEMLKWKEGRKKKLGKEKERRKPSFKTGVYQPDNPKFLVSSDSANTSQLEPQTPGKTTPFKYLLSSTRKGNRTPATGMKKVPVFRPGGTPSSALARVPKFHTGVTPLTSSSTQVAGQRKGAARGLENANPANKTSAAAKRSKQAVPLDAEGATSPKFRLTRRRKIAMAELGVRPLPVTPQPAKPFTPTRTRTSQPHSSHQSFAPDNFSFKFEVSKHPVTTLELDGEKTSKDLDENVATTKATSSKAVLEESPSAEALSEVQTHPPSFVAPSEGVQAESIDIKPIEEEPTDIKPIEEEPIEEPTDVEPIEVPINVEPIEEEPSYVEPIEEEPSDVEPIEEEPSDVEPIEEVPSDVVESSEEGQTDSTNNDMPSEKTQTEHTNVEAPMEEAWTKIGEEAQTEAPSKEVHTENSMEDKFEDAEVNVEDNINVIGEEEAATSTGNRCDNFNEKEATEGKNDMTLGTDSLDGHIVADEEEPKGKVGHSRKSSTAMPAKDISKSPVCCSTELVTPVHNRLRPKTPCSRSTRRSLLAHCDITPELVRTSRRSARKSVTTKKVFASEFKTEDTVPKMILPNTDDCHDESYSNDNDMVSITPVVTGQCEQFWKVEASPWIDKCRRSDKKRRATPDFQIPDYIPSDGSPFPAHLIPLPANTEGPMHSPVLPTDTTCINLNPFLEPSSLAEDTYSPDIDVWGSDSPAPTATTTLTTPLTSRQSLDNKENVSGSHHTSSKGSAEKLVSPCPALSTGKERGRRRSLRRSVMFTLKETEDEGASLRFPATPVSKSIRMSMGVFAKTDTDADQPYTPGQNLLSFDTPESEKTNATKGKNKKAGRTSTRVSLLPGLNLSPTAVKELPDTLDLISWESPASTSKAGSRATPARRSRRVRKVPNL